MKLEWHVVDDTNEVATEGIVVGAGPADISLGARPTCSSLTTRQLRSQGQSGTRDGGRPPAVPFGRGASGGHRRS
ncbi:hypothetical protein Nepgr_027157 [Nepenthes gracilis]|uniref:Uncharacterized protein n=1 Tax=Nepenthes gracilis TaxID=150966 RepID=A0AAD3T9U1_NEPGR|nr:hypothetical protein Nepgr_027157 [Nepenthes gracilis]